MMGSSHPCVGKILLRFVAVTKKTLHIDVVYVVPSLRILHRKLEERSN